jgi:hypothetical protein
VDKIVKPCRLRNQAGRAVVGHSGTGSAWETHQVLQGMKARELVGVEVVGSPLSQAETLPLDIFGPQIAARLSVSYLDHSYGPYGVPCCPKTYPPYAGHREFYTRPTSCDT